MTLKEFNQEIKETIQSYYKNHDADSFFKIDSMLRAAHKYNFTKEQVPQLIEMQNIIVMG